jgi:hypothetical protein
VWLAKASCIKFCKQKVIKITFAAAEIAAIGNKQLDHQPADKQVFYWLNGISSRRGARGDRANI